MPYYPLAALRSPTVPTRKVAPFRFRPVSNFGDYDWKLTGYSAYVKDGFERNPVIYSALMYKVRAISQAPLRLYTGDFEQRDTVDLQHPAWQTWLNPNEHQSMMEFMQQAICYLNLAGNNYIYLDWDGDRLRALYSLRPDRVRIIAKNNELTGFMYAPNGWHDKASMIPMLPKNILHIKFPNPDDDLEGMGYGLSPMSALAYAGDIENSETTFLHRFFSRGIAAMGAITYEGVLTEAMRERIREEWMDTYGGATEWSKPMVFDKGTGWQVISPPFEHLDFQVLDKRNEARQTAPLGVDGMLIGLPGAMERSTFNNMAEVVKNFWENTFIPELLLFEVEFQRRLTTADGIFPAFDLTKVPALKRAMETLVTPFTELVKVGVPPNIAAQVVGMNLPTYAGDNVSYMPIGLRPAGSPLPAPPTLPALPESDDDEEPGDMAEPTEPNRDELALVMVSDTKHWTPEEKAIFWKALDDLATDHEAAFGDAAVTAFRRDQAEIGALLTEIVVQKSRSLKASLNWLQALPSIQDWLRAAGPEQWREVFLPVQVALVEDTAHLWAIEMGLGFDIPNVESMTWFQDYTLQFAQPINNTTSKNITDLLTIGQNEGWSIDTMQNHLGELFDQYVSGNLTSEDFQWFTDRMPAYRRELIARTETTRMANAGSVNLFRNWGASGKEWLSTMDSRVRDSHAVMNGQQRPINEPFESGNGAQLRYPGDPAAPLEETANCRCATAPLLDLVQMNMVRCNLEQKGFLVSQAKSNQK